MPEASDALVPYGWDGHVEVLYRGIPEGNHEPGRVVRVERGACVVQCSAGSRPAAGHPPPAVGDWVAVGPTLSGPSAVEAILPRWSVLSRRDPDRDVEQVLASNVDVVLVVAPADRFHPARVERELLIAWESGADPVVVLTKADLVPGADQVRASAERRLVGARVILTSTVTGDGMGEVARVLQPNRSGALIGPSGAGKSSLANALLGEATLATAGVRASDRRGRHTTTSRHLVPVPTGGVLIDTPGLRSLPLWRGDDGLAAAFADVEELAQGCRFADCRHDREPGCAVQAASALGTLDASRLASYRKLSGEVDVAERDQETRRRQPAPRSPKAVTKAPRRERGRPPREPRS